MTHRLRTNIRHIRVNSMLYPIYFLLQQEIPLT